MCHSAKPNRKIPKINAIKILDFDRGYLGNCFFFTVEFLASSCVKLFYVPNQGGRGFHWIRLFDTTSVICDKCVQPSDFTRTVCNKHSGLQFELPTHLVAE